MENDKERNRWFVFLKQCGLNKQQFRELKNLLNKYEYEKVRERLKEYGKL